MSQWTDFQPGANGTNAAPSSGVFTLTAASDVVQRLTPTAAGQYVQLYTALDAGERAGVHVLMNLGPFTVAVKDSTGVIRGHIRPMENVTVHLGDDSTAAGGWIFTGSDKLGITGEYEDTTNSLGSTTRVVAVTVDSTRTFFLYGDTAVYAVCFNKSTASWGSYALVRSSAGSGIFDAILHSSDKIVAVSCSSTTGLEAMVITLSGTTISTNVAGTQTLGGNINSLSNLALLGTSVIFGVVRSNLNAELFAVGVSGTTATIGTAASMSASVNAQVPHLYVSGSVVIAMGYGGNVIYARPYTVSGSTLTVGTPASTIAASNAAIRTVALGSRWVIIYTDSSTCKAAIVALSGTTTTLGTGVTALTGNPAPTTGVDAIVCNSKLVVVGLNTTPRFNILTDTAGTLTAGSELTITGGTALPAFVSAASTTCRAAGSDGRIYTVSASAASPTATQKLLQASTTPIAYPAISEPVGCSRSWKNLTVGNYVYTLPTSGQHLATLAVGPSDARVLALDAMTVGAAGAVGSASSESWVAGASVAGGFFLQRVEGAAP